MKEEVKTLAIFGDLGLNDISLKDLEKDFIKLRNIFLNFDFITGNLETPAKIEGKVNYLKSPRVNAVPNNFVALKLLNISYLNLANNHIGDCMDEGAELTLKLLNDIGIQSGGIIVNNKGENFKLFKFNNIKIGIVSFIENNTHPNLPKDSKINLRFLDSGMKINEISKFKKNVDILIVHIHWGIDFFPYPTEFQRDIGKKIIDAGADLIVGHHNHIISPYEIYKGKYIFYGLGNFYFPDINYNGKKLIWEKEERKGLLPAFKINNHELLLKNLYVIDNLKTGLEIFEVTEENNNLLMKENVYWGKCKYYLLKIYYTKFLLIRRIISNKINYLIKRK